MWIDSIRYFNGNRLCVYTAGKNGVQFIQYREGQDKATVTLTDGTCIKIHSPFIEYQSIMCDDDSREAKEFGW